MPNIEIKAKCRSFERAYEVVKDLEANEIGCLHQVDTYYKTKEGRLKLREINGKEAQLIPYFKEYSKGPMKSLYSLLPVSDKENLKEILHRILGEITIVDKKREVFLIDNVRLHLDRVKGLGTFIEFEAVYDNDTPAEREREVKNVQKLMKVFHVDESDLLNKSYIDYFLNSETKLISNNVEILYFFSNNTYSLIETKNLFIEKNEAPEKRFFWFLFDHNKQELIHLKFKSMKSDEYYDYRHLGDFEVKFNLEGAKVENSELNLSLEQKHPMFMNDLLKNKIINFLS